MKLGPVTLSALPAMTLPRLPLAAFRRRLLVRGVFVLLTLATLALAVTLLAEEKQRSRQRYVDGFGRTLAAIVAQLRHPSGQLALLNAGTVAPAPSDATGLAPLLLPFSAIDFDDPFKARQAVETSGCALQYPGGAQLCAAVGHGGWAGGFVYLVASFHARPAVARERGGLEIDAVHRARIDVQARGIAEAWTAAFEAAGDAPAQRIGGALRGRLTGFAGAAERLDVRARPDRDFRGWLWQDGECVDAQAALPDCARRTLLSIRVPVQPWRDALAQRLPGTWPPPDLAQVRLRLQWVAPGGGVLFDSVAPGAQAPFALQDLAARLGAGETLTIERLGGGSGPAPGASLLRTLRGADDGSAATSSPWLVRLIDHLPVADGQPAHGAGMPVRADDEVRTPVGSFRVRLEGDPASVDRSLGATATRLAWFVGAMLGALALGWLLIEIGLMRRMAILTRRAATLSHRLRDAQPEPPLGDLEVADLRGPDELGILAGTLGELLARVREGVRLEHVRAAQQRELWHAVGHEIMSPLQSLLALHGRGDDPSRRYVQRMQQAVRVLYGSAPPSEAIAAASLDLAAMDLDAFLRDVAANAAYAALHDVAYLSPGQPVPVRGDVHSLEDAVAHVLRNADRHREPGTPITMRLVRDGAMAELTVHNRGSRIQPGMLDRIFEYGVSGVDSAADVGAGAERRGQGLFVARTYLAKMGGTIGARNADDGVEFVVRLPVVG